jgi:thioredoxin 1
MGLDNADKASDGDSGLVNLFAEHRSLFTPSLADVKEQMIRPSSPWRSDSNPQSDAQHSLIDRGFLSNLTIDLQRPGGGPKVSPSIPSLERADFKPFLPTIMDKFGSEQSFRELADKSGHVTKESLGAALDKYKGVIETREAEQMDLDTPSAGATGQLAKLKEVADAITAMARDFDGLTKPESKNEIRWQDLREMQLDAQLNSHVRGRLRHAPDTEADKNDAEKSSPIDQSALRKQAVETLKPYIGELERKWGTIATFSQLTGGDKSGVLTKTQLGLEIEKQQHRVDNITKDMDKTGLLPGMSEAETREVRTKNDLRLNGLKTLSDNFDLYKVSTAAGLTVDDLHRAHQWSQKSLESGKQAMTEKVTVIPKDPGKTGDLASAKTGDLASAKASERLPQISRPADQTKAIELTSKEEFDRKVLHSDTPVVVDFNATWCAPCRRLKPNIDELSREMSGRAPVYSVDIDKNPWAAAYASHIPTVINFNKGAEASRTVGYTELSTLKSHIETELGKLPPISPRSTPESIAKDKLPEDIRPGQKPVENYTGPMITASNGRRYPAFGPHGENNFQLDKDGNQHWLGFVGRSAHHRR